MSPRRGRKSVGRDLALPVNGVSHTCSSWLPAAASMLARQSRSNGHHRLTHLRLTWLCRRAQIIGGIATGLSHVAGLSRRHYIAESIDSARRGAHNFVTNRSPSGLPSPPDTQADVDAGGAMSFGFTGRHRRRRSLRLPRDLLPGLYSRHCQNLDGLRPSFCTPSPALVVGLVCSASPSPHGFINTDIDGLPVEGPGDL